MKLLKVQEALKFIREEYGVVISEYTFRTWLRRGLISNYKLGGTVYIEQDSLVKYLSGGSDAIECNKN